jgi:hypothetical protein
MRPEGSLGRVGVASYQQPEEAAHHSPCSFRSRAATGTRIRFPILIVGMSPRWAASYAWFLPMPRTLAASGTVMVKRVDSAFTPKPYRYLPGAWVFCNHDGTPISPNYFSIMWSRACGAGGLAQADIP